MEYSCEVCNKRFKSLSGFRGHQQLIHNVVNDSQALQTPKNQSFLDLKQQLRDQVEMLQLQEMIKTLKQPVQAQNNMKDTLEMMKLMKEISPASPLQTYKEIKELIGSEGGSAEGGEWDSEKMLLAMLPSLLNKQPAAPGNAAPQVQPQVAQPAESENMDLKTLAKDLLDYIPENYKNDIKDGKITKEQARALILKNMFIIKPIFKKNYGEELTPDLLDELLEEGFNQLIQ